MYKAFPSGGLMNRQLTANPAVAQSIALRQGGGLNGSPTERSPITAPSLLLCKMDKKPVLGKTTLNKVIRRSPQAPKAETEKRAIFNLNGSSHSPVELRCVHFQV